MKRTFGQFSTDKPEGMLRAARFPQLMLMDTETGDGRLFESGGSGVRELPRTLYAQFAQSGGHSGSVPIGSLQEVTMDDDGNVSGRAWLVDLPHVRDTFVPLIVTKTLFHNSVDLADVDYEIRWKSDDPSSPDFWEYSLVFTKWNIAASTLVGVPAFADARVLLDNEVTAALMTSDSELEVNFGEYSFHLEGINDEVTAAAAVNTEATVPYADFHIPEAPEHTPFTLDGEGRMFGHLARWGECHEGIEDRCVLAPRPNDYSEFHAPGVLTDRGMVEVGPVFLLGGHPAKPLGNGDRWAAYGGIENAVGDIRVVNGQLGPWCSGRVRPGVTPDAVYAARASRKSGHWRRNNSLAAVVCVNVPGFTVPGSTLSWDHDGAIVRDGEVMELVASLRAPLPDFEPPAETTEAVTLTSADGNLSLTLAGASINDMVRSRQALAAELTSDTSTAEAEIDDDVEADVLAIELDLDELDEMDSELPMALASGNDS